MESNWPCRGVDVYNIGRAAEPREPPKPRVPHTSRVVSPEIAAVRNPLPAVRIAKRAHHRRSAHSRHIIYGRERHVAAWREHSQVVCRALLQEKDILARVGDGDGEIADGEECRFGWTVCDGDGELVKPVRQALAHLIIHPLRIADGKDLGCVREVRRYPFVILPEAAVREWERPRQKRRDAVCRD